MIAIQFVLAALILLFATGGQAETTNDLSTAEIQGRQLAQQLCEAQPAENFTNTGVLQIRPKDGPRSELHFQFRAEITPTNWQGIYETTSESYRVEFKIIHNDDQVDYYEVRNGQAEQVPPTTSFAGSDFYLSDLGLEFFHWSAQKILPNPTSLKLGRSYKLLESTNPDSSTNGYSRVLSWIDRESGGILQAEAYDTQGNVLKKFYPKDYKKDANGHWQLKMMEMDNVQTGSRTRLEFDVKK